MSLYVHPDNQTLLWNIIDNNEMVTQFFSRSPPQIKDKWFKEIIRMFYEKTGNKMMNNHELLQINRDTISYVISTLKEELERRSTVTNQPMNQNFPIQPTNIYTPPVIKENKQEALNQQFDMRQKNYQDMFDRKAPENIDFREKIDDEPMSNMEDIIKSHMRQREEELYNFAPPGPLPLSVPSPLVIDNSSKNNIQLLPTDILYNDQEQIKEKKSVSWGENSNEKNLVKEVERDEINYLKILIQDMMKKISTLENEIESLKSNREELSSLKTSVMEMLQKISTLEQDIAALKTKE